MASLLTIVVPIGVVALLLFGAMRYLLRSWIDYRVRVGILEELERRPDLLTVPADAEGDAHHAASPSRDNRVDYVVMGVALGVMGMASAAIGWTMRVGQLAVGAYLGGIFCICLGFLFAFFGYLTRRMTASGQHNA